MRIASKLLLSFSVVGALPVLIALGIIQSTVRQSARAIDQAVRSRIEDFRIISLDPTLYASPRDEVTQRLQSIVKSVPIYLAFYVVNREGDVQASSDPAQLDRKIFDIVPDIRPEF